MMALLRANSSHRVCACAWGWSGEGCLGVRFVIFFTLVHMSLVVPRPKLSHHFSQECSRAVTCFCWFWAALRLSLVS